MTEQRRRPILQACRAALSLAGLGVATYLSVSYMTGQAPACGPVGGCGQVTTSAYARFLGTPIAMLGLALYAFLLLGSVSVLAFPSLSAPMSVALAIVSGGGFLFSSYLTGVEVFVLRAICVWCVTSALLVTGIFALSLAEAVAPPKPPAGASAGSATGV
ncbi:MAG: vitamin K epoxide reductase family protein [Chloroflexota bacterium]